MLKNTPLLSNTLAPRAASMPSLIDLNACSSDTGFGTHLKNVNHTWTCSQGMSGQKSHARHAHESVCDVDHFNVRGSTSEANGVDHGFYVVGGS